MRVVWNHSEQLLRFALRQVSAKSSDRVHVRILFPVGITPSFSFYPLSLKKCVFSHQFILCGLSYKNDPAGFSIWKTCFSFVETYIIFFFFFAGFLLCCFKLKANVLPSPSFLLPHPHLCMFQLQSCENKSSFGFCYFKTAIGDVRVNTKSIKNAGRM